MYRFEGRRTIAASSILPAAMLALGIWACSDAHERPAPSVSHPYQAESTRLMAERLATLERELDPRTNAYRADLLVAFYDDIEPPPDRRSQVQMRARRASALLHDGRTDDAIRELDAVLAEVTAQAKGRGRK